ncbi:MAG: hypothetical protein NC548_06540 [Lachnospiraceae bacterium]|nr:hypothetical protein [Lachnospiraceae bacterium]
MSDEIKSYVSTTMGAGPDVKEALEKIENYAPQTYSWFEVPDTSTVDLGEVTSPINGYLPGDYVIYSYIGAPGEVTRIPLNLSIRMDSIGTLHAALLDGADCYVKVGTGAWEALGAASENINILTIARTDAPPEDTNILWLDCTKYADEGFVDLKFHDGENWVSVFYNSPVMDQTVYDKQGKNLPIFTYINDIVTNAVGAYGVFLQHKANELTLVHITDGEREVFNSTLLMEGDLINLLNTVYKTQINKAVEEELERITKTDESSQTISDKATALSEHIAQHITIGDTQKWDAKADSTHTHDHDSRVKITAENVTSGKFKPEQIPDDVRERYYLLTSLQEFGRISITDEDRRTKYHNGNGFYMPAVDDNGNNYHRWFRIINSDKIGTANYMDGILEFTTKITAISWENIIGKPNSLAGYGITDGLSKAEVEADMAPIEQDHVANDTQYQDSALSRSYIFSLAGIKVWKVGFQTKEAQNPTVINDITEGSILDAVILTEDGRIFRTCEMDDGSAHLGAWFYQVVTDDAIGYYRERFPDAYDIDEDNPNWENDRYGMSIDITEQTESIDTYYPIGDKEIPVHIDFDSSEIVYKQPIPDVIRDSINIDTNANPDMEEISDAITDLHGVLGHPETTNRRIVIEAGMALITTIDTTRNITIGGATE